MGFNNLFLEAVWSGEKAEAGVKRLQNGIAGVNRETQQYNSTTDAARRQTDEAAKGMRGMAGAASMSSEKIARYGTFALVASGQMRQLGVSTELVSTSVLVAQQAMMGMLGTFGIVTVAVGAVVAIISKLVSEQKRLKEETEKATKALIEQGNVRERVRKSVSEAVERSAQTVKEELDALLARADAINAILRKQGAAAPAGAFEMGPRGEAEILRPGFAPADITALTRAPQGITDIERKRLEQTLLGLEGQIGELQKELDLLTGAFHEAALDLGTFNPYNPEAFGPEEAPRYLMRRAVEAAPRLEPIGIERMRGAEQFSRRDFKKEQEKYKSEFDEINAEFHKRVAEDIEFTRQQMLTVGAQLQTGLEGAFQAARGGWQSLVDYMKEYIMSQLIQSLAGSLVNAILGPAGGASYGIFGKLFGGGAQANPTSYGVAGAYRDNASWRMMR